MWGPQRILRVLPGAFGLLVFALPAFAVDGEPRDYVDLQAVAAEVEAWVASPPEGVLTARVDLGRTREGREVPALAIGAAGPVPLDARPTVFVLGGIDGVSLAGAEAARDVAGALLADPGSWREDVTLVVVPWASPDGLTRTFQDGAAGGVGARAGDHDGDGREAEDGPDDLDGDGFVLEMLIEDAEGPWALAPDGRLPVLARPGDAPRFRRVREGRDDDGDGRFNEDAGRGACLDHNFPIGWDQAPVERRGERPMSEPLARSLASEILARDTALVLVLQGDHGGLARPGGTADIRVERPDAQAFARWAGAFDAALGRQSTTVRPLAETGRGPRGGTLIDWCYAVPGVPALEVAPWGAAVACDGAPDVPLVGVEEDTASWSHWLDREQAGMGFAEWRPVDLGPTVQARVGGWEPRTRHNPPAHELAAAIDGFEGFVHAAVEGLPRLEIGVRPAEREGPVVRVSATVRSRGAWPTALASRGRWPGRELGGTRLALDLPPGARLLAGEALVALEPLAPGASSPRHEWLLVLPEGAALTLRALAPACPERTRELRP